METATEKLGGLSVVTMGSDFSDTNAEIQNFLKEFSKAYAPLGPSLTETSVEAKSAFAEIAGVSARLNKMLDPSSDFRFGFSDTLRRLRLWQSHSSAWPTFWRETPKPSSGANQETSRMKTSMATCFFLFPLVLLLPPASSPNPTMSNRLTTFFRNCNRIVTTLRRLAGFLFYVRQVELPSYLQESRLVSRPQQGLIEFTENDRWGEPLEEGIARVLGLNLSKRLNALSYSVSPHRQKPSCMFELGIAVRRFEQVDSQTVLLGVLCDLHSADGVKHFPFATQVDFAQESDARDPSREVLALQSSALAVV